MGILTFSGKFDLKMQNLYNLKQKILFFEMGVNQNSRFKVLWKILIVYNMIKKEVTDKVDHNSVQISCKNKGQMIASVHSLLSVASFTPAIIDLFLKKSTDSGNQLS